MSDLRSARRDWRVVLALILAVVVVGCTTERRLAITTHEPTDCGPTGVERLRLHGDPAASEPVWLVGVDSGRRYRVSWPSGYTAVYRPPLEVHNRNGQAIARVGDVLDIDGTVLDDDLVWICSIVGVNAVSPPPEPVPTAVPVPTRRPPDAPPPRGTGVVELGVCGETDEGYEEIEQFLVRFEPLEGQPGKQFNVDDGDCELHPYEVAAGRYVIEIRAPGWQPYRTDPVDVLLRDTGSPRLAVGLHRAEASPTR